MKNIVLNILERYLQIFPEEAKRQSQFIDFLNKNDDSAIKDWNNFNGHIVAGGFIYAREENKVLVLYHKDLKMFLYPGGHTEKNDKTPLETAQREILEETGLRDLEQLKVSEEKLIPIDIDTHKIPYNEKLKIPGHYHFDFRYLFIVKKMEDIKVDTEELTNYQWISIQELRNDSNYEKIALKIEKVLPKNK